ncbi:MAG: hypothetical protein WBC36_15150 [Desulfobacterales bacterium]|jgi:hypothetical protein
MKYEIFLSERKTYLQILVNEPVTSELLKDFIGETARKAYEFRIDNFLFDLRCAPDQAEVTDHYVMVYKRSPKLGFKSRSKHALLVSQKDMDDYSFVESILINAGYQSKTFTDELSAIEWLEKDTPVPN